MENTGILLLFLVTFCSEAKVSAGKGDTARLIRDLLQGYDRDARPIENVSDPIKVFFSMSYNQLQNLDEPTQAARSLVWINTYWTDIYMKWNASEYGGTKEIRISPTRIWIPDLTLYNNANEEGGALYDLDYKLILRNDGYVSLVCPLIVESVCPINIEYFPFDTQKCKLKIGSWVYDGFSLDLHVLESSNGINMANLDSNSVWEFKSVQVQRHSIKYPCCDAPYVDITYTFEFRRKPLYYIMTIIFPSILLSLLACISFLFPASSGERVSLVISVLLGLVVFMLIVNDRTPVTSDNTPMLTQFFNCIGASTVLALMATAFILRLNHAPVSEPVPRYLACIRDCIASALRMRRTNHSPKAKATIHFDNVTMAASQVFNNGHLSIPLHLGTRDFGAIVGQRKPLIEDKILMELEKLTAHLKEENEANEMKADWQFTMRVFDRFFFVFFFVVCIVFVCYVFSY